jgi:formylglycine-generating enzyme required for sulfatase activity
VRALCVDVTEVTVADYQTCVDEGACTTNDLNRWAPCNWGIAGRERQPMNCLSFRQANAVCAHAGKRIPSEGEWFHAAYGTDGRRYPWGNETPAAQLCWDGKGNELGAGKRAGKTCPVGSYPAGRSPFGLGDMAGNVWEWTTQKIGPQTMIRGGGATTGRADWVSSTFYTAAWPGENGNDVGVRCVYDAPSE